MVCYAAEYGKNARVQKAHPFPKELMNLLYVINAQPKKYTKYVSFLVIVNSKLLSLFFFVSLISLFCSCQKHYSINFNMSCQRKYPLFFKVSSVVKQKRVSLWLCGNLTAADSVGNT